MIDKNNNGIDDSQESIRYAEEIDRDKKKWTVRRRMAITAMVSLLLFGIYYALVGLFITEVQSKVIAEFNGIVVAVIGALTSVLLGYYGTAYLDGSTKRQPHDE